MCLFDTPRFTSPSLLQSTDDEQMMMIEKRSLLIGGNSLHVCTLLGKFLFHRGEEIGWLLLHLAVLRTERLARVRVQVESLPGVPVLARGPGPAQACVVTVGELQVLDYTRSR